MEKLTFSWSDFAALNIISRKKKKNAKYSFHLKSQIYLVAICSNNKIFYLNIIIKALNKNRSGH